jgi:hypothetical protein
MSTSVIIGGPAVAPPMPQRWARFFVVAIAAVVSSIGAYAGVAHVQTVRHPTRVAAVPPNSAAVEQRWGIRVSHLGVSADGGLVEVRFMVLDSDRALELLSKDKNLPVLHVDGTARVVRSAAMMPMKHEVAVGRSAFVLYRNTGGAVHPGSSVTLQFGSLRLPDVVVD